jgi:hypothetical protein
MDTDSKKSMLVYVRRLAWDEDCHSSVHSWFPIDTHEFLVAIISALFIRV